MCSSHDFIMMSLSCSLVTSLNCYVSIAGIYFGIIIQAVLEVGTPYIRNH
jgi:hypothetical protein